MPTVTLLVLQGLERGQLYRDLAVPISIGREEDNTIQLNDERISRCHVKIQQDQDRIILTDLESTNGSRVNGLPVKMTVLRPGDLISLGRCVLLFGSRAEIRRHCHELHRRSLEAQCAIDTAEPDNSAKIGSGTVEEQQKLSVGDGASEPETLELFDEHGQPIIPFPGGRPPLPRDLSLHARSAISDLLAYLHNSILHVLESRTLNGPTADGKQSATEQQEFARISWPLWFLLLDLEADLSHYLRELPEPDDFG